MYKYYSIHRPVGIGTFPKPEGNTVISIENYDERKYIKEIGREAWGAITYASALSEKDARDYELTYIPKQSKEIKELSRFLGKKLLPHY